MHIWYVCFVFPYFVCRIYVIYSCVFLGTACMSVHVIMRACVCHQAAVTRLTTLPGIAFFHLPPPHSPLPLLLLPLFLIFPRGDRRVKERDLEIEISWAHSTLDWWPPAYQCVCIFSVGWSVCICSMCKCVRACTHVTKRAHELALSVRLHINSAVMYTSPEICTHIHKYTHTTHTHTHTNTHTHTHVGHTHYVQLSTHVFQCGTPEMCRTCVATHILHISEFQQKCVKYIYTLTMCNSRHMFFNVAIQKCVQYVQQCVQNMCVTLYTYFPISIYMSPGICKYSHLHKHIHTTHTCICLKTSTHTHLHLPPHTRTYMYTSSDICYVLSHPLAHICISCTSAPASAHTHIRVCISTHPLIHTCTYIRTHVHTCIPLQISTTSPDIRSHTSAPSSAPYTRVYVSRDALIHIGTYICTTHTWVNLHTSAHTQSHYTYMYTSPHIRSYTFRPYISYTFAPYIRLYISTHMRWLRLEGSFKL